jgi:thiol:disulfide interchange protein DsbD
MTTLPRLLLALFLAGLALPAGAAESIAVTSPRAVATLVSDTDRVAAGTPFKLGLRLRMAPGWHTYWRNPGDAGIAPELHFTLPDGASAGPIAWPAPQRQPEGPLMTYGYSGEVLLAVPVTGPAGTVQLHATWLVCKEICVPEEGDFRLDLPAGTPAASPQAPLFAAAEAALPRPSPWPAQIAPDGTLTVTSDAISPAVVRDAWFIPETADTVIGPAPQTLRVENGSFSLALKPGEAFRADAALAGVLTLRDAGDQTTVLAIAATPGGPPAAPGVALWRVIGFALLGGLILNLMPCVFPVLAVKAVGLAGLSGAAHRHAVAHALSYTAGVVSTFMLVGAALLALRAAGDTAGWGFQFQSPAFVAGIAWVLFAVGLNLSGVYDVRLGAAGAGQSLAARGGHAGSFFTGLLAVLVATPCTAPFMGVAIGAALASGSAGLTMAVFLAMGIGLAAPFVLLAALPAVARILPRPGRWMELVRQTLAFPMYAASAWLVWVMSQEAGPGGVAGTAAGMVLVGFVAWALGMGQRGIDEGGLGARGRRIVHAAALAAALAALAVLSGIVASPGVPAGPAAEAGVEPFSADRLDRLRRDGRPVFVNITAAWCVTCLVNERVALAQPAVRQAFAALGVVYLKGDWTRQDAAITRFLRSHGRDGVPLYVLYPPGNRAVAVLPQILTEGIVLAALEQMGAM